MGVLSLELAHGLSRLDLEVSLTLEEGTLALVGPSGSGKSTILRAVAGLLRPNQGRIVHGDLVLLDTDGGIDLPPEARRVGMVQQDGALFPFMDVLSNVAYGVRAVRGQRRAKAAAVLERFGIGYLSRARPGDLSGGERQRVALARALASEPRLLLLDEPLSALDSVTKAEIATELEMRLEGSGLPAILVTHDFGDALGLARRVAVIQEGRIVQTGSATDLLEAPASAFVASLAGVNYFAGTASRRGDLTEIFSMGWTRSLLSTEEASGPVGVVVHPWDVSLGLSSPEGSALNAIAGRVRRVVHMGNRARVSIEAPPPIVAEVTEGSVERLGLRPGTEVVATWKATATRLVPVAPALDTRSV